ncbi:hypothetical protein DB32_000504 [Sandaracinus amylolyticus]|uniref:Uncharacterized protein n=1 Tax=Sandaracinus amylolyticus TaxID=927083 RepID=A0A0F6VZ66_9BACT|nr:hypothetical protein DB32_000504 [Sandaracinus amylolyticus]
MWRASMFPTGGSAGSVLAGGRGSVRNWTASGGCRTFAYICLLR